MLVVGSHLNVSTDPVVEDEEDDEEEDEEEEDEEEDEEDDEEEDDEELVVVGVMQLSMEKEPVQLKVA